MGTSLNLQDVARSLLGDTRPSGSPSQVDPAEARTDKVPGLIDGKQQVALSEGEYIIPADVVTKIGRGNLKVGSKILQDYVEHVRDAPEDGLNVMPAENLGAV